MMSMNYEISAEPGFLRAKLRNRETIEESREFLEGIALENKVHRRSGILVDVRASRPIFHVDRHGLFDQCRRLLAGASCRIALLGDTKELRLSHDYIALLARQQGLDVRSFRNEVDALRWLQDRRIPKERRGTEDRRRPGTERRAQHRRADGGGGGSHLMPALR